MCFVSNETNTSSCHPLIKYKHYSDVYKIHYHIISSQITCTSYYRSPQCIAQETTFNYRYLYMLSHSPGGADCCNFQMGIRYLFIYFYFSTSTTKSLGITWYLLTFSSAAMLNDIWNTSKGKFVLHVFHRFHRRLSTDFLEMVQMRFLKIYF